jgi:citrate lyase beta subunit
LRGKGEGIKIIAMIENAKGMINIEKIARAGTGYLDGLFAAEDCAQDSRNRG